MPHLHLSLQAGDDMILKRMKRRHDRRQSIDFCARVRKARPDVAFGADLIAGFQTETDEMFENTLRLIDECDIVFGNRSEEHTSELLSLMRLSYAVFCLQNTTN